MVITSNYGCFSEIGRQGEPQELSLNRVTCLSKGVILHELMHSIGFIHEHSRTDRDSYVKILWDNIETEEHQNFNKYSDVEVKYKMDYEYESIMHYEYNAFAKSKELTSIKPLDDSIPLSNLGSAKKAGIFTNNDLKKVKQYYDCVA